MPLDLNISFGVFLHSSVEASTENEPVGSKPGNQASKMPRGNTTRSHAVQPRKRPEERLHLLPNQDHQRERERESDEASLRILENSTAAKAPRTTRPDGERLAVLLNNTRSLELHRHEDLQASSELSRQSAEYGWLVVDKSSSGGEATDTPPSITTSDGERMVLGQCVTEKSATDTAAEHMAEAVATQHLPETLKADLRAAGWSETSITTAISGQGSQVQTLRAWFEKLQQSDVREELGPKAGFMESKAVKLSSGKENKAGSGDPEDARKASLEQFFERSDVAVADETYNVEMLPDEDDVMEKHEGGAGNGQSDEESWTLV